MVSFPDDLPLRDGNRPDGRIGPGTPFGATGQIQGPLHIKFRTVHGSSGIFEELREKLWLGGFRTIRAEAKIWMFENRFQLV
jgi:hypothetical protein